MDNKAVKIIPLGGLGEIGKNITVIEFDNEIIVIDCGIAFPDEEMYDVDAVILPVNVFEAEICNIRYPKSKPGA